MTERPPYYATATAPAATVAPEPDPEAGELYHWIVEYLELERRMTIQRLKLLDRVIAGIAKKAN